MAKKCPPGVICFENFTFTFVIIAIIIFMYIIYNRQTSINIQLPKENNNTNTNNTNRGLFARPSFSFSNVENDVLMNPYTPPLKDERIIQSQDVRGGIPININTRAVDTSYRQVGILKENEWSRDGFSINGKTIICWS